MLAFAGALKAVPFLRYNGGLNLRLFPWLLKVSSIIGIENILIYTELDCRLIESVFELFIWSRKDSGTSRFITN